MKTFTIILLAFLFSHNLVCAQEVGFSLGTNFHFQKTKTKKFGSLNKILIDGDHESPIVLEEYIKENKLDNNIGLNAGIILEWNLYKKLSISSGLNVNFSRQKLTLKHSTPFSGIYEYFLLTPADSNIQFSNGQATLYTTNKIFSIQIPINLSYRLSDHFIAKIGGGIQSPIVTYHKIELEEFNFDTNMGEMFFSIPNPNDGDRTGTNFKDVSYFINGGFGYEWEKLSIDLFFGKYITNMMHGSFELNPYYIQFGVTYKLGNFENIND